MQHQNRSRGFVLVQYGMMHWKPTPVTACTDPLSRIPRSLCDHIRQLCMCTLQRICFQDLTIDNKSSGIFPVLLVMLGTQSTQGQLGKYRVGQRVNEVLTSLSWT